METQERAIGNQTTIDVVLSESLIGLEEVTGSVASLSSDDFIQGDMLSPLGAIQGKPHSEVLKSLHEKAGMYKILVLKTTTIRNYWHCNA